MRAWSESHGPGLCDQPITYSITGSTVPLMKSRESADLTFINKLINEEECSNVLHYFSIRLGGSRITLACENGVIVNAEIAEANDGRKFLAIPSIENEKKTCLAFEDLF